MKLALLGDLHFGIRSGDQNFLDFQKTWISSHFLPYCQDKGIDTIFQSGDWFDTRSHIKLNVLHEHLHWLKPELKKYGIRRVIVIAGNHDTFYRDNNNVASIDLLTLLSDNDIEFRIIKNEYQSIGMFGFVPWLNKNNQELILSQIANEKVARYLIGHFDMVGMPMYRGIIADHGLDPEIFKRFTRVFSGHYHTVSSYKNIQYLGTPYHLTWMDYPDSTERGFWVLDTSDDSLEFIKNEEHMTMFAEIEYDPKEKYDEKTFEPFTGNLVKVYVNENPDEKHYKKFCALLSKAPFLDYKIIDTTKVIVEKVSISEKALKVSTLSAITEYVDKQDTTVDKTKVKEIAKSIYIEAMSK